MFVYLFILIDPPGNLLLRCRFLEPEGGSAAGRARRAGVSCGVALVLFGLTVVGGLGIDPRAPCIVGIPVWAFSIAAGILLGPLAFIMVDPGFLPLGRSGERGEEVVSTAARAAVPFGFPYMVGPGTVATLLSSIHTPGTLFFVSGAASVWPVVLAGAAVLAFSFLLFSLLKPAWVAGDFAQAISRLFGVFLLAIAAYLLIDGIRTGLTQPQVC
jgi:small neutral amino acid transporter SnatA (MarC family)